MQINKTDICQGSKLWQHWYRLKLAISCYTFQSNLLKNCTHSNQTFFENSFWKFRSVQSMDRDESVAAKNLSIMWTHLEIRSAYFKVHLTWQKTIQYVEYSLVDEILNPSSKCSYLWPDRNLYNTQILKLHKTYEHFLAWDLIVPVTLYTFFKFNFKDVWSRWVARNV